MSDKKKRNEQNPDREDRHEDRANHSGELIDHDPERAENVIDVEEAAEHANQVSSPNPEDPQHPKQGVPPDQENVPRGFTTGSGMQGGSANRRKR